MYMDLCDQEQNGEIYFTPAYNANTGHRLFLLVFETTTRGSSSVFTRTMSYNKYTKSRLSRHDAFLHHTCIRLPNPASGRFTNLKFTVMDSAGLIFDFDETEFGPNHGYVRSVIVERPICIVIDVPRLDTFFSFGR